MFSPPEDHVIESCESTPIRAGQDPRSPSLKRATNTGRSHMITIRVNNVTVFEIDDSRVRIGSCDETGVFENDSHNRKNVFMRTPSGKESTTHSYMWLALCTTLFNPLFGVTALVLAMHSDNAHAHYRHRRAQMFGKAVQVTCVFGVMTSIAVLVFIGIFISKQDHS